MNMPTWLARHLETTGDTGPDAITRRVRGRACKTCGRFILTGLDAHRAGGPTRLDPTPLAPLGEALAQIAGLNTFDLHWTGQRLELEHRDASTITAHPAGTQPHIDVVAQHTCTHTRYPSLPSAHTPTTPPGDADEPPF